MSATESARPNPAGAHALGLLRIGGPEARDFLQGQLSNDLRLLSPVMPLLASLNTPQGRVIAVLRLIEHEHSVLALLPAALIDAVIVRLRKYVLRSKVELTDISTTPDGAALLAEIFSAADANAWRLREIEAGRPQIHPETSELFVAQMLNLDLVEGISFSKGCYTGQEIIARTQHRGRIKRRLLRFRVAGRPELRRGEMLTLEAARSARLVDFAYRPDGDTELLAVVSLARTEHEAAVAELPQLQAEQLPLPYFIPTSAE